MIYCTIQCCDELYCTTLHNTILWLTILCCNILECTALSCTTVYCTICELITLFRFVCLSQVCSLSIACHGCLASSLMSACFGTMKITLRLSSSTERLCCSLVRQEMLLLTLMPLLSWSLVRPAAQRSSRLKTTVFYCILFCSRI